MIYYRLNTYIYRCKKVTKGWVSQPAVADYPKLLTGYIGVNAKFRNHGKLPIINTLRQ
jgi:hypothetical protein